jgi:hypothetical protein
MLNFKKIQMPTATLPYGQYVITDPCYVMPDDLWDALIDDVFYPVSEKAQPDCGLVEIEGFRIWWGNTAYGDGSFDVLQGNHRLGEIGVDAGMIAFMPLEFVEKYSKDKNLLKKNNGIAVQAPVGGAVRYMEGNVRCGAISITTDGSDEEAENGN